MLMTTRKPLFAKTEWRKRLMLLIRIVLCMPFAVTVLTAHAQDSTDGVSAINQRMQVTPVLRGEFAQEKHFSILSRPLKSTGHFTLDSKQGIWWHNTTPVPGDLVLGDKGIVQRDTQGRTEKLDGSRQPALKLMTGIIRQLVSGDWLQLQQHFDIDARLVGNHWEATLMPKTGSMFSAHAARIDISGNAHVEHIELLEKNTDRTRIVFSNLNGDTQLQPGEVDAFAW